MAARGDFYDYRDKDGNKSVTMPFGKQDCTVFRKVMSTEDTIQEFASA